LNAFDDPVDNNPESEEKPLEAMQDDFGETLAEAPADETADMVGDLFDKDEIAKAQSESFAKVESEDETQTAVSEEDAFERKGLSYPLEWTRENIECLLIAMLMALFIRHYGFEPFQIPTGSMATTLFGKHVIVPCPKCESQFTLSASDSYLANVTDCPFCKQEIDVDTGQLRVWGGEKILANKLSYRFGSRPGRYDTIVFRPPDRHQNFIKRMVSAGGETIYIHHGDLFYRKDGEEVKKIAAKPAIIQKDIWIKMYDLGHDIKLTDYFESQSNDDLDETADWYRDVNSATGRTRAYVFKRVGHMRDRKLSWNLGGSHKVQNTLSYNVSEVGNHYGVGDLRIKGSFALTGKAPGIEDLFSLTMLDGNLTIVLKFGIKSTLTITAAENENGETPEPKVVPISSQYVSNFVRGSQYSFDLMNWDDQIKLKVNGKEVIELLDISSLRGTDSFSDHDHNTFFLTGNNLDFEVSQLRVSRDIYYKEDGACYHVPKDHFFAMGDNVNNSSDSRNWGHVSFERLQGRPWKHLIHWDLDQPFSPRPQDGPFGWDFGDVN
jgi:signal peptidase I